ncbi:DUF4345 domain-containing protein [Roseibium sp.]|uniref:DUF4345 domain-containing protein n=1 Tax=Roseibium sp. TaxID=1936156 RepID=UPI003BAE65F7
MSRVAPKVALALSALTFVSIGGLIVFAPAFLFGLNQVQLDPSAALMSEIRAPGALILLAAGIAIAGLLRETMERPALLVSAGLLLAYGVGRLISLPLDGLPPVSLVIAMAVEFGLGSWCALLAAPARPASLRAT